MIKSKKLSKFKNIEHAFFNRLDCEYKGIYKGLDYGPDSSNKKKIISKSIKIIQKKIKPKSKKIILLNQIHSNKFYYLNENIKLFDRKFKGDALITNKKKIPIGVLTADCAPVLISDHKRKMIAAIHSGWKGAYKGIIQKVIKFMIKKGCTSKDITAVIGPCISFKSYEIKQDFIKKFIKKDKNNIVFSKKLGIKIFLT